jgi:hypothetical protein
MLRVLWQKSMIALARAPRLKRYVQSRGLARRLARKYVAGGTAAAAVRRAEELLRDHNLRGSLFFLGEYVDEPTLVAENVAGGIDAARALGESGSCRQTGHGGVCGRVRGGALWIGVWHPFVSGPLSRWLPIEKMIEHVLGTGEVWFARLEGHRRACARAARTRRIRDPRRPAALL